MTQFNQSETIKKIEKYFNSFDTDKKPVRKKMFLDFNKSHFKRFMKWIDKHPEYLDTKDIKFVNKNERLNPK